MTRGEATISELSRDLGIGRSLLQRWKRLLARGGEAAVRDRLAGVPEAEHRVVELLEQ